MQRRKRMSEVSVFADMHFPILLWRLVAPLYQYWLTTLSICPVFSGW